MTENGDKTIKLVIGLDGQSSGEKALEFANSIAANSASCELIVVYERWSRIFGPVVKVDCMTKEVIPNDKTKEPFARFQS
jgi:hypothetical protein